MNSIFINDLTCLDFAYVDEEGQIRGHSYMVSCLVEGDLNGQEAVVIDFSTGKKQIKELIDGRHGLDHKLLFFQHPNCTIDITSDVSKIDTPHYKLVTPSTAISVVPIVLDDNGEFSLRDSVKNFLDNLFCTNFTDIKVTVSKLSETGSINNLLNNTTVLEYFNYTHGLKNSTSYGCQNIAHGHLSFIEVTIDDCTWTNYNRINNALSNVKNEINNKMFVFNENLVDNHTISYESSRGLFVLEFKDEEFFNKTTCILNTETTIENIVKFVEERLKFYLDGDLRPITHLFVSEGLQKGSLLRNTYA